MFLEKTNFALFPVWAKRIFGSNQIYYRSGNGIVRMICKLAVIHIRIGFKLIHTGVKNLLVLSIAKVNLVGFNFVDNKAVSFYH